MITESINLRVSSLIPLKSRKTFFRATSRLLKWPLNCDGQIFISFLFPQFRSFYSLIHSFHWLMNSMNWPASSVWVFIAHLVEHCSANAEATGSNPVEARKNLFFELLRNCLNCHSIAIVTYSSHLYSRSSHHFILSFLFVGVVFWVLRKTESLGKYKVSRKSCFCLAPVYHLHLSSAKTRQPKKSRM